MQNINFSCIFVDKRFTGCFLSETYTYTCTSYSSDYRYLVQLLWTHQIYIHGQRANLTDLITCNCKAVTFRSTHLYIRHNGSFGSRFMDKLQPFYLLHVRRGITDYQIWILKIGLVSQISFFFFIKLEIYGEK